MKINYMDQIDHKNKVTYKMKSFCEHLMLTIHIISTVTMKHVELTLGDQ